MMNLPAAAPAATAPLGDTAAPPAPAANLLDSGADALGAATGALVDSAAAPAAPFAALLDVLQSASAEPAQQDSAPHTAPDANAAQALATMLPAMGGLPLAALAGHGAPGATPDSVAAVAAALTAPAAQAAARLAAASADAAAATATPDAAAHAAAAAAATAPAAQGAPAIHGAAAAGAAASSAAPAATDNASPASASGAASNGAAAPGAALAAAPAAGAAPLNPALALQAARQAEAARLAEAARPAAAPADAAQHAARAALAGNSPRPAGTAAPVPAGAPALRTLAGAADAALASPAQPTDSTAAPLTAKEHASLAGDGQRQPEAAALPGLRGVLPGAANTSDSLRLSGPPEQWQQPLRAALGERLTLQLARNDEHAVIRLEPPNMGSVEISVRNSGGNLHVNLAASHNEVLRQLNSIGDAMRQDLAQRTQGEVAVTVSASGQRSLAEGGGQGRQQQQAQQDRAPGRALDQGDAPPTTFAMTNNE